MHLIFKGFLSLVLVLSLWSCQGMTGALPTGFNADSSDPESDETILATADEGSGDSGADFRDSAVMGTPNPELESGAEGPSPMAPRSGTPSAIGAPSEERTVVADGGTVPAPHDFEAVNPQNVFALFIPENLTLPWNSAEGFKEWIRSRSIDNSARDAIARQIHTYQLQVYFPENIERNRAAERRAEMAESITVADSKIIPGIATEHIPNGIIEFNNTIKGPVQLYLPNHIIHPSIDSKIILKESLQPDHCSYFSGSLIREHILCTTREQLIAKLRTHFTNPLFMLEDGSYNPFGPGRYVIVAIKETELEVRSWPVVFSNFAELQNIFKERVLGPTAPLDLNGYLEIVDPTRLLIEHTRNRLQDPDQAPLFILP